MLRWFPVALARVLTPVPAVSVLRVGYNDASTTKFVTTPVVSSVPGSVVELTTAVAVGILSFAEPAACVNSTAKRVSVDQAASGHTERPFALAIVTFPKPRQGRWWR